MSGTLVRTLARAIGATAFALVLSACAPEETPNQTGVGQPLPDTFPVTGVESDLPEGKPLPPESSPTPPEAETTPAQPF